VTKRTKMPTDVNQRGKVTVDIAAGLVEIPDPNAGKDAAAVARGRKGGQKGGAARATKLTAKERSNIARKAVTTRWANR